MGLTVLRQSVILGTTTLRRRMLVTLEINNKDRSYDWFLAWMAHNQNTTANIHTRAPSWIRSHQLSVETTYEQRNNGSSSVLFKLVAGPGTHWFKYRGAWMQVRTTNKYVIPSSSCDVQSCRSNANARRERCSSCLVSHGRR